jgi:hypothetical protein
MQPLLLLLIAVPLTAASASETPAARASSPPAAGPQDDLKEEYQKRRDAAEGDVAKLWEVVNWCEANSLDRERRSCLRAIVKLDDEDKKAHELLGHVYYDGQWFTTEKKLAEYKEKEATRLAKEQGLVPYKDGYAHPDDIPYLEQGLVKTDDGRWVDPVELKRIEEGWRLHDLIWISPEEFEKEDAGLFKCGDEWLSLEDANAYHAAIGTWWGIPGSYFHVYTTLPREVALQARDVVDQTFRDLTKIYGITSSEPLSVIVLRSAEQYGSFAAGEDNVRPGTDASGLSSVHGAFFADALIDYEGRTWNGCGVGYWDFTSDAGTQFGKTFARHAAGQSFSERADPSPKAIAAFEGSAQSPFSVEEFYAEKKVPIWFRYGAATYVERYHEDPFVVSDGDPLWARKWSIENIARSGGLDPLDRIFEFAVTSDDPVTSAKLINESGLLVAFLLDGKCAPVAEAHGAVKAALRSGEDPTKAFRKLEKELRDNEAKISAFAGI